MSSCSSSPNDASPMVSNRLDPRPPSRGSQPWRTHVVVPLDGAAFDAAMRWQRTAALTATRRTTSDESIHRTPPLSERDSIFATTHGTHDDADAAAVYSSQHALQTYGRADLSATGHTLDDTVVLSTQPDAARRSTLSSVLLATKGSHLPQDLRLESLSHGPHRNDSDLLKRVKNLEKRQHRARSAQTPPQLEQYFSAGGTEAGEAGPEKPAGDKLHGSLGAALNLQEGRKHTGRSSSKGRPKQSIEATLNKEAPRVNTRSRKASHYLGLFKENAAAEDQKKLSDLLESSQDDDTVREHRQRVGSPRTNHFAEHVFVSPSPPAATASQLDETPVKTHFEGKATHIDSRESLVYRDVEESVSPISPSVFRANARSPTLVQDSSSKPKESIEWRSGTPSGDSLPLRLLEEIRSRPKLSPPANYRRAESLSYHEDSSDTIQSVARAVHTERLIGQAALNLKLKIGAEEDEEDAESDSDKEHISSATYFPHQAPSPGDSDENPDLEKVPKLDLEDKALLSPQTIAIDAVVSEALPESQHSAKSLQSKATVRSIQEKFDRGHLGSQIYEVTEVSDTIYASESSLSDTEHESTDGTLPSDTELHSPSFGDKGDITPTATPRAHRSHLSPRARRAPLGAVELKPYKHQVGGHTKVFSFSRQAICKQLNNRENEFYEVIERSHPELLKFLPKYLGVLNVTYQKVSRRKKRSEESGHGSHDNDSEGRVNKNTFKHVAESESNTAVRPHSAPRAISHSQHFESHEDAVPQVVYANNMHMIPTNLFPVSPQHHPSLRAHSSSNAVSSSRLSRETLNQSPSNWSSKLSDRRMSIPQSPSWGATMVNTQFKDKVLREVFSPPVVHHRKRQIYARRDAGHHIRGRSHMAHLSYPEPSEHHGLTRSITPDIASTREPFQAPFQPPPRRRQEIISPEDKKSSSARAPQLTEASLAALETAPSAQSDSSDASHVDGRIIGRRRSGGGLRRGPIDIDDHKRSNFKYFEDEDMIADENADTMFPFDFAAPRTASTASSRVVDEKAATYDHVSNYMVSSTAHGIDSSLAMSSGVKTTPVNPVQAQQQPDKQVRHFLLLEDLTANMSRPCVLDLKMGTRQYGVEATKKKQMSQRQKCKTTTSYQLGVRVCGMQMWNAHRKEYIFEDKYAGRDVKPGRDFQNALVRFLHDGTSESSVARHIPILLDKLSKLEKIILTLPGYRFYASSLLMLYDGAYGKHAAGDNVDQRQNGHMRREAGQGYSEKTDTAAESDIDIRLVDFANCVTAEDELPPETPCPPGDRYGIDRGYIRGLRSLRMYLQRIWKEIEEHKWVERGEGEGMGLRMKGAGLGMDQPDSWKEGYEDPGDVSV